MLCRRVGGIADNSRMKKIFGPVDPSTMAKVKVISRASIADDADVGEALSALAKAIIQLGDSIHDLEQEIRSVARKCK